MHSLITTVESSNTVKLKSLVEAITEIQNCHSTKLLFITSCMKFVFQYRIHRSQCRDQTEETRTGIVLFICDC